MGLERVKRELTSHFVIESPCPPDVTIGVGKFDSTRATPAGAVTTREKSASRQYDATFAGASSKYLANHDTFMPFQDNRPHSAKRIFASTLASGFHVHDCPAYRPEIRITHDKTISQMTTSSLTPTNVDPPQQRKLYTADFVHISHDTPGCPDMRTTQRRHLRPRIDPLDGTELQPQPTLAQKMQLTYPFNHRHGRKHFHVKDMLFHEPIPLPPNVMNLPPYPAPRPQVKRGVSPFIPANNFRRGHVTL